MASLKRFSALGGGVPTDPQFNLTTLLLHGDGTNGAQNNTFVDSSSNNFTITRNGNTTQGTFTPFSQTGWSNFFDGTGDYLFNSEISAYNVISGQDFTVEGWVYLAASGTAPFFIFGASKTAYDADIGIYVRSNAATVRIYPGGSTDGSATTFTASFPSTMPLNQWNHWALVRSSSGTSIRAYLNGVGGTAVTASGAIDPYLRRGDLAGAIGIYLGVGDASWTSYNPIYLNGYQSNVRYVVGTAIYTANFTPPTAPLTAVTNTQYLSCQSNSFIDTSSNARAITPFGNVSVQAFSPFAPTSAYSTSAVGGSGYFDGTGDYLSVADNAALRLGTSAFTIQAWIYRSVAGVAHSIIAKGASTTGYVLQVTSTNVLRFTHGSTNVSTTATIPAGTWTHVAAVRTGTGTNGFQLFINGVSSVTATVATDLNQTDTLYVGADRLAANVMNGYISGLRYVVGTAETITIPTAPPTAITNTQLLTNFTNAGIIDNTSENVLETVGNAQISTAQSKFGGGSILFDGTGDYLQAPASANNFFGTGDFTIEAWVYIAGNSAQNNSAVRDAGILALSSASQAALGLVILGNGTTTGTGLQLFQNVPVTSDLKVTGTISQLTWHHIAVSRAGTSVRFFLNGTQMGATQTNSSSWGSSTFPLFVGSFRLPGFLDDLNGYIDDLRVTRGFARYTANFTPPTAPFLDQ